MAPPIDSQVCSCRRFLMTCWRLCCTRGYLLNWPLPCTRISSSVVVWFHCQAACVIQSLQDFPNFSLPAQGFLCCHLLHLFPTHVLFVQVVKYIRYSTLCNLEAALLPSVWTPALWNLSFCLGSPAFSWSILSSRAKKLPSKCSVP